MYQEGLGIPQSDEEAANGILNRPELGKFQRPVQSWFKCAIMVKALNRTIEEAVKWYRMAAEQDTWKLRMACRHIQRRYL